MFLTCRHQYAILCLLALLGNCYAVQATTKPKVQICYHDGEWPPYIYFKRDKNILESNRVEGASVALFDRIFKALKLNYSITMMPWKRCLYEVDTFGDNQKYEMFFNGSYNDDRASKYYITSAMYRTRQALFYSRKKYPQAPVIKSAADLKEYTLCGILGYNYTMHRKAGITNPIDTRARSLSAVLDLIDNDRCDFFPSPMEPIFAGKQLGVYQYSEYIDAIEVPWVGTTTFHAFIAKSSPRAFELYTQINHQLQILQGQGESDEIFRQWLENGDGL